MAKYRILSIDGGGIRGIIPAIFLQRLNDHPALEGWLDAVDLIAGTSTGGLIALGIAAGIDLAKIRELYETKGEEIFDDSWVDDLFDLGKVIGADYDNKNLRRELKRLLGNTALKQLKKKVLITAFDLDNGSKDPNKRSWKPKLFHNLPNRESDGEQLAYKVGMYTSAAPTYFPPEDGYIDGGVYAPNPSMCALAQSRDSRLKKPKSLSDIVLFSIGTGTSLTYIKLKKPDWGYAQWVKPLIGIWLDGVAGIADFQCKQLLMDRYYRLAPTFPPGTNIPMDGVKKVPYMIEFASKYKLHKAIQWIKRQWL